MKKSPIVLSLAAIAMAGATTSCNTNPVEKPNIIYIMADDHAYQAMSCYGSDLNETPNIDRIAEEGMRFENSFVTNSICAPSRAVLLTGKHSHLNGQLTNGNTFDGDQLTFPKLLQETGYQTAMIGKWHLRSDPQGFDYWNVLPGQGHYYNPDFIEMGERKRHTGYVTDITTDFALDWLKNQRDPERPFCMLLHHKAPHRNWKPAQEYLTLFDDTTFDPPANFFDTYENRGSAAREQEMEIAEHMRWGHDFKFVVDPNGDSTGFMRELNRLNEEQLAGWNAAYEPKNQSLTENMLQGKELAIWKYNRYIKDYLRCIQSVDDNVGRVLDYLEETGLDENTMVIYTSDQGFYLGEHGWFDKRFMYEESHRMPLVIKYPGRVAPGTVNSDMVMNLDFAPTFLDYAGIPVPEEMQGKSMRPVLEGNTAEGEFREAVYYHYFEYPAVHMVKRHYGVRTSRYKLIHFYYDVDEWELYDLEEDPAEMNNIYGDPGTEELIEGLKEKLYELKEAYGDTPELEEKHLPDRMKRKVKNKN